MKSLTRLGTGFAAALLEAWQELRIHKLRVLLSLVGVTIAVASLTTALAGAGMARQMMTENLESEGRPAMIVVYAFDPNSDGGPAGNAQIDEVSSPGFGRGSFSCFPTRLPRACQAVPSTVDEHPPATCTRVPNAGAGSCTSQPIEKSRP